MNRSRNYWALRLGLTAVSAALIGFASPARAQEPEPCAPGDELCELKHDNDVKGGLPIEDFLSSGGMFAVFGRGEPVQSPGELNRGGHDNGRGGNTFVNDPCLDPNPPRRDRTVQSETEIAVLNAPGSMGKRMVAGWNDSYGFYNNKQGLSGFGYSTDGGSTWIDGAGLPPRVPTGLPAGTAGQDAYFGDPVVVVHHGTGNFYYASIYLSQAGYFTLSVNRGHFQTAPPQGVESVSNTRCANDPSQNEIPAPPANQKERIIWELPVEAVPPPFLGAGNQDFLDKEWLYVDQNSGELYLTYTRFADDGSTPIELVRSMDQGQTWTPPTVIVPNEAFDFNQATQAFTTPTGRVIVTWNRRRFGQTPPFAETENAIEYAYSDDDGATFTTERLVAIVRPQGEPPGYNRGRLTILNAPYIFVDRGSDDGAFTPQERAKSGFGNVYITYFDGVTNLPQTIPPTNQLPAQCLPPNTLSQSECNPFVRAARILLSTSTDNGESFGAPVQVNDDATLTTHVFPSVQANKNGDVYVAWIDRRQDPNPFIPGSVIPGTGTPPGPPTVTPAGGGNIFNDTYAAVSKNSGAAFGHNKVQTKVSTSWFVRADARPNFGDYNSSELLGFNQFVTIWADGRFPLGTFIPPAPTPTNPNRDPRLSATPDVIFTIAQGLGIGGN